MFLPRQLRAGFVLGGLSIAGATFASATPIVDSASQAVHTAGETLAQMIDRVPDLVDLGLPGFAPPGSVYFYAHPKFGDLLHEDYFRLPLGVRVKVRDDTELHAELDTYFTHGLRGNAGNGLYEASIGLKQEVRLPDNTGASVGLDFFTPLSRPPLGITDGLRHTVPYVTFTRTIWPRQHMIGFATFGADVIDHTALAPDYFKNELRANSLTLTVGAAREWRHVNLILKLTEANTYLLSHIHENTFGIRPGAAVPLLLRPDGTPRLTATFEGRTVWGPDGFEVGVTTSVRIDLRYHHPRD